MTGTERSSEPQQSADEGGRRGRILMIAGALIGTLMLASAGILVGGASTARRLDAVDWHHTGPGARDGSTPVAAESRLRTAPGPSTTPTRAPAAPATRAPSTPSMRVPSVPPTHPSSVARRPTPKQAHPTPRRTNSPRPTPVSPTPAPELVTPAVHSTRPSVAPPPGQTRVPPGQTRHPRKH
ncbi:hypothetical protein AB0K16_04045 [Nonomuraea jabiensis]|uniref:hypothetical protein n=1 Tax=Nonomuraea jabiensis TaxID=882448 RepID=UPI0034275347